MRRIGFFALVLLLAVIGAFSACDREDDDTDLDDDSVPDDDDIDDDDTQDPLDADGDGWTTVEGDCDDGDPGVYPGADDPPCDGVDHDCDGALGAYLGAVAYASVQQAIDAAVSGDTVSVCTGRHVEQLTVTEQSQLHLTSESGDPSETVLDGGRRGPILTVGSHVDEIRIDGLTFQNGDTSDEISGEQSGGAIHSDAGYLMVDACVFLDNRAESTGGAVYHTGAEALFSVCGFEGNEAGSGGGAIALSDGQGTYEVRDSSFDSNSAGHQGGAVDYVGTLEVNDCCFTGNESGDYGGAVFAQFSDVGSLAMADSTMEHNQSLDGGALAFIGVDGVSSVISVGTSSFVENHASSSGGSMCWEGFGYNDVSTSFVIEDSSFEGNTADSTGGAVSIDGTGITLSTVQRTTFTGNSASSAGAFSVAPDVVMELQLHDCEFADNRGEAYGGAMAIGGGSHNEGEPLEVSLTDVTFTGGQAFRGGALWCNSGLTGGHLPVRMMGGAVLLSEQGGAYVDAGCRLESEDVDWGSGVTDNVPHDVDTGAHVYDEYGSGATFTCEGDNACF